MITRAIRHHLSKDTAKNEKDEFSSKSIHIAPITNMVDHRGVYFFDIHAKSGHSIGTNQERYLDRNNLAMNLAGEYALHGWVDETPKKSYQTFHWIGPHVTEQAHWLIKELYILYVQKFNKYDSLYYVF